MEGNYKLIHIINYFFVARFLAYFIFLNLFYVCVSLDPRCLPNYILCPYSIILCIVMSS